MRLAPCPALRRHLASFPMLLRAALLFWMVFIAPAAAQWRADVVPTSGRVTAIDVDGPLVRIAVGANWYRLANDAAGLVPASSPDRPKLPRDALADGRMIVGAAQVARAWLAAPTSRYDHGVLGDAIEAGSLVIERLDGRHGSVTRPRRGVRGSSPRIASIDGRDWIVVVKSYLDRGSALAIIDADSMTIAAETPPIGHAHAWLNPAGIADYDGNGTTDIALVRQPHVVGRLELWSWKDRKLTKVIEVAEVTNHFIGSRARLELDCRFRWRRPSRSGGAQPGSENAADHQFCA